MKDIDVWDKVVIIKTWKKAKVTHKNMDMKTGIFWGDGKAWIWEVEYDLEDLEKIK